MKKRILYVEDDAINALVMEKLLNEFYNVIHCTDGEGGLEAISNETFDVVLMDINLGRGKMDGIETMKKMKAMHGSVKVIAVTSYALPEDKSRFLDEGFDDYIPKPVDRAIMLDRIGQLMLPLQNR